jgi:hypothetical protein
VIDLGDVELVGSRAWCLHRPRNVSYARSPKLATYMHNVILGTKTLIDHVNGDGLDNRRCNLRVASTVQNAANTASRGGRSRFKGVVWNGRAGKWQAQISVTTAAGVRKCKYLGVFEIEEEAAAAYDVVALAQHGEFVRPNLVGAH